ncbi:MAG: hypothetical protein C5B49_13545 [Bdellovibrio sp.]|nr:MAG: hypothetical protein C5B49_13545 [Bdellovibrio sp.]
MAQPSSLKAASDGARADYPFGAELFAAKKAQYAETVLLVPFYGGKKFQLHRHIDLLNDLGFNVVTYDQPAGYSFVPLFMSPQKGIGFKHVWADQVEALLNEIHGRKILFAMSNPASGAIEAIARRGAYDIVALICDSGPTANFWESSLNYLTTEEPVPTKVLRMALATLSTTLWAPDFRSTLLKDLKRFPPHFPILSIRGWKDHLISPKYVDMVFEPISHLDWRKLSLPEADHLTGLRDFPEEYGPAVARFLSELTLTKL